MAALSSCPIMPAPSPSSSQQAPSSFAPSLYHGLIIRKRFAWGMWFTGTVTHVVVHEHRRVQDERRVPVQDPCGEPCGPVVLGSPSTNTVGVGGNKLLNDNILAQCWPHVDL